MARGRTPHSRAVGRGGAGRARRGALTMGVVAGLLLTALAGCSSAGSSTLGAVAASVSPAGAEVPISASPGAAVSAATSVTVPASSSTPAPPPPPPAPAVLTLTPADGTAAANPGDPITATVADGTLGTVRLVAEDGTEVAGTLADDRRSWTSAANLDYDTDYTLTADATNAARPGTTASA